MRCQEFKEMMDSYLGDELLVETNHDVLRHQENCPACRNELAARRGLLTQMRSAVKNAPEMQLNQVFATKLRNNLRETALRPSVWEKLKSGSFSNSRFLAATAACLLLMTLFGVVWFNQSSPAENIAAVGENQTNKPDELSRPTESPVTQAVQITWRELTHSAIGDHKNCALHFRLDEEPISLKAAEKYGKFNKGLDKTVAASLSEIFPEKQLGKTSDKVQIFEAHSCVFQGRRFAHVILLYQNRRISVLVTEANFPIETDEEIFSEATEGMLVARFRTARHAVFVVSDLTATENVTIAQNLSPAIRRHIEQSGSGV
ncbi:MAG: zf-HC2 domain-containing protein [Acidobacteria bacterium]|nr:zf-HC2 domain-containing protein [Acidobacteriota bacterium]MCA1640063.1 zf-HC2 domain-containing protein [Acidobacteriota bacterium]